MNVAPGQFAADAGAPLGERLRELRQLHGLTLRDLAAKVGVTATALHSWECGRRNPKLKHIQAFANAFSLTKSELLSGLGRETTQAIPPADDRRRSGRQAQLAEVVASCKERIALAAGISAERVRIVIEV